MGRQVSELAEGDSWEGKGLVVGATEEVQMVEAYGHHLRGKVKALDSTLVSFVRFVDVVDDDDSCVTQRGRQAACAKLEAVRMYQSFLTLRADHQNPPCPAKHVAV